MLEPLAKVSIPSGHPTEHKWNPPPQRWLAQEQPRFPLQMNLPLPCPCSASSLPQGPGRSAFSPLCTALSRGLCHPTTNHGVPPSCRMASLPHLESTANIPTSATSCSRSTHLSLSCPYSCSLKFPALWYPSPRPGLPPSPSAVPTPRSSPCPWLCCSGLVLQGDLVLCDFEQGRWPLIP